MALPSTPPQPANNKSTPVRLLILGLALLAGIALVLRLFGPAQKATVYEPPPAPPKTVADVEKEIKDVTTNKHIPDSQKGRILGFLQADLQKAKKAEGGGAAAQSPPTASAPK